MWSSQNWMNNIIPLSSQINWEATWIYLNNNTNRTSLYTNFTLSNSKSFKIKLQLNILPILFHLHNLYPEVITSNSCITCHASEHSLHWILCPNPILLTNLIQETIAETITHITDITTTQINKLQEILTQHNSLSLSNITLQQTNIYTTLQGYVSISLISSIRPFTQSQTEAKNITTKLLHKLSQKVYEQIWKPYCKKLAQWKKDNNILQHTREKQQRPIRTNYNDTYYINRNQLHSTTCNLCGLSSFKHTDPNTCPPLGHALCKINIWLDHWILYSYPTNNILYYQI